MVSRLTREWPQRSASIELALLLRPLQRTESRCISLQVPDVEKFMADYNMQCPMAAKRLIYSGMPATVEHGKPRYGVSSRRDRRHTTDTFPSCVE